MRFSLSIRVVVSSFIVLAFHGVGFAMEWHEAYTKGQKAIDRGKCAEGVPLIQEALKSRPQTDLKARPYGTFTLEYIPYFYLAKCAVESGDIQSAQNYMKQAEQGSVFSSSKASEYEQIRLKFQQSQKSKPPVTPPANTTTPAKKPDAPVPVEPPKPVEKEVPKKDANVEMIQKYLGEASAALRSGDLATARNAANRVLILDANNSEARRMLGDINKREQASLDRQDLQRKIDAIRVAIRSGDLNSAETMAISLKSEHPSDNSVSSLYEEIQNKKRQQQSVAQQTEVNRMIEKQIFSAYYSGQYPAVIQLAERNLKDNPNNWKLHFYLGCAYAALSILETEDRETRLQNARESFRRAKTIAGNISLPPLISPKIVEVFRNS